MPYELSCLVHESTISFSFSFPADISNLTNTSALRPGRGGKARGTTDSSPGLGNVVIFDWAEKLRDLLSRQDLHPSAAGTDSEEGIAVADRSEACIQERPGGVSRDFWGDLEHKRSYRERTGRATVTGSTSGDGISGGGGGGVLAEAVEDVKEEEGFVEIFHGVSFTDRKSTFQAHLARVSSEKQVRTYSVCVNMYVLPQVPR